MRNNRKGRILLPLLALMAVALLLTLLGGGFTISAQGEHNHDGIEWQAWTSTNSLPTAAGSYYLTADVTISSTWNVPSGTTNLCLNDHKIAYGGSSGSVIRINSGSTLNLHDCGTTEHYYYIGAASTYNSNCLGAIVASASDANYVNAERRGSFVGGYITGGYGTSYSGSTVFGGGVFVDGGTFVLNGGCIFGNRLSVRDGGNGGGGVAVRKTTSSFVMNGGYIIGNHAGRFGGGIRIDGGSFVMNGGEVRHNTANTPGSGGAGCGGGLHMGGLDGGATVKITGGIIEGNYAGLKDGRGGGINVAGGTLSMTGGTVVGNNATLSGGGVNGAFSLSGNVTVTGNTVGGTFVADSYTLSGGTVNNVYLPTDKTITIAGAVTTGTDVGITLESVSGKFTAGWNTAMGNAEPGTYFKSDNGNYGVLLKDNEAQVGEKPHEHDGLTFTKWTSTNSLPSTAGNYYLASDVTISSTWNVPLGTTNFCLNGHGIKMTGSGCVIKVGEGNTLKLYDCDTTTEHRYSVSNPAANGAGVATVNDALTSNYQTFTGGYITGGYMTGGYQYGAGINLEGNGATLYMYGGTIIGNRLTASSTGGGGVCVQDWDKSGGFYMYGGSIIGNTSNYGAGVYVRTGKMELHGGNISKNVANGNIGGGVLVFGGNSTLDVKGGSISENTAVHGGAVEASGDGTVIITGGSFMNNLATGKGGALTNQRTDGNTSPASFNISGAPVFSGNTAGGSANDIYLCNTAVLNLTAAMTKTTKIGITLQNGTGAFTKGWSTYMTDGDGNVADPSNYFVSDNTAYVVKLDASGEAKIAPPHTHNWSYTAVGNVITATCTGTGTCDLAPQTITINAAGKVYDGTAVTATISKSANWDTYGLATVGDITYSGNTNAGTYTASVTVEGKTASIGFTIAKASLTVTAQAKSKTYGENDPAFTYIAEGLIGTDTLSGELSRETGENVGIYAITQGTLANDNYSIAYTGANLTINAAPMTVAAAGYTGDYDGAAHGISVVVTIPDGATVQYGTEENIYTLDETPTYSDAGTYTVYYEVKKANYITVHGFETVTIRQINATVTITGNNSTVDYDGTEHFVTGFSATASTALYDVAKDFTFSGEAVISWTNAGTEYMELKKEQFANNNANFATVTFEIVDGYLTINQINATVTITGHNGTVNYDKTEHTVVGYEAVASTDLYDATRVLTFSGNATAALTDVGTAYMGLSAEMFANADTNFATVTFEIVDGYLTVEPVDARITTAPASTDPVYNGVDQALIYAGEVEGGILYYALGDADGNAPDDTGYQIGIPFASEIGNYYIWYKVEADANHNDLSPECLRVTLAQSDWEVLHGVLYQSDGVTPIDGATVMLVKGDQKVDATTTENGGKYRFAVPTGVYNIVAEYATNAVTVLVTVSEQTEQDIVMPDGKTESVLHVNADDEEHFGVAVGGLDQEAYAIRKAEQVPEDKTVSVVMTVEQKTDGAAANAESIRRFAENKTLEFFEIKVEKTIDSVASVLDETANVLEIVVPYEKTDKKGITVYSYHGTAVLTFTESNSKQSGTFRVDRENGLVYIYSNRFSTFAIGYTPYYRVNSSISLGSFGGTATVTLKNQATGAVFTVETANLAAVRFEGVPAGQYTMTVTWIDGAENTLTMPLTVGNVAKTTEEAAESSESFSGFHAAESFAPYTLSAVSPLEAADDFVSVNIIDGYHEPEQFSAFGIAGTVYTAEESKKQRESVVEPKRRDVFLI